MEQKELLEGRCSFYENVRAKRNVTMYVDEFVNHIRSERWKPPVLNYRKLLAEGNLAAAEEVKKQMPALVVAGVCEGGHCKANFQSFSGYLMLDVDGFEGDIDSLLKLFEQRPWTKSGWKSISKKGFKLVILVRARTLEEYEQIAYPIVARHVARLIKAPVDMQCKDLTRTCYASYDPDAFLKPSCTPFPWRDMAEVLDSQGLNPDGTPKWKPVVSSGEQTLKGEETATSPVAVQQSSSGMLQNFLQNFLENNPYVPHYRHNFLLKLGRAAHRMGMNDTELNELILLAQSKLEMPDCPAAEIRSTILDSHRFMSQHPERNPLPFRFKGSWGQPMSDSDPDDPLDQEEETLERNRQVRTEAPFFPEWIFSALPRMLQMGLQVAKHERQRDMLLMSMLTNLSGCMPNVRMLYDDTYVYPHLFLAVVASAASGKGIMANAAKLGQLIQKQLDEDNKQRQREYEECLFSWEQERAQAAREKRKPKMELQPDAPLRQTLLVPADTSRTQLIQLMAGSPQGVLMNVSEMDTLRAAVNVEYGKFDDLMRACFHHEMFGSDFKSDKRSYIVYTPKMAFCASGTPSQFYKLCPSVESGAYSRYLIYMAEQEHDFLSMAPGGDRRNKYELFKKLSEQTLAMYRYLKAYPTEVFFTPDQWDLHKSYFQAALRGVRVEEVDGPVSVVFRHGLNTARLAMILTALRKYEAEWSFRDMTCTDEDFQLSLSLMEVLLEHSLMLSTSMRKQQVSPKDMRHYFLVQSALEKLNPEFSYHELIEALVSTGMSVATAKRCRKRLLNHQIIVQEGDKYGFGSRKWRIRIRKEGEFKHT